MTHVRTQLRDAAAIVLAPAGAVHKSRSYSLAESELAAILVYTNAESIDLDENAAFDLYDRTLALVVEPIVQATADVDTALDTLIEAIEMAIGADPGLGGLALHCLLRSIEVTISTEGAQPIARARMTYEVRYRTAFENPSTAI